MLYNGYKNEDMLMIKYYIIRYMKKIYVFKK